VKDAATSAPPPQDGGPHQILTTRSERLRRIERFVFLTILRLGSALLSTYFYYEMALSYGQNAGCAAGAVMFAL
jgi:hypothetical protein